MAIDAADLDLRFETRLLRAGGSYYLALDWQVYHAKWVPETILDRGTVQERVKDFAAIADVDAGLQALLGAKLKEVRGYHQGRGSIDGFSLYDADRIFASWTFHDNGDGTWTMAHPITGEFTGEMENTPLGRVSAILAVALGPTAWAWGDSVTPGQLRVRCLAVDGADHYAAYLDGVYLGDFANPALATFDVAGGVYSVQVAAVAANGRVGILSAPVSVEVGALAALGSVEEVAALAAEPSGGLELRGFWRGLLFRRV